MSSTEDKTASLEPIWTRPEPGARRPAYSREAIARTAVAIADAEGLEAVSMRRVAAELGAGTMTLYHYVSTKAELETLMDDTIMSELIVPDDELSPDWRQALAQIARRTREIHTHHPWSHELRYQQHLGPNALRHVEQSLAAVAATGLSPAQRIEIILLVDDYVHGHVARVAILAGPDGFGGEESRAVWLTDYISAYLDQNDLPNLRELVGDDIAGAMREFGSQIAAGDRFERGLQQLLDGIALEVRRATDAQAAR